MFVFWRSEVAVQIMQLIDNIGQAAADGGEVVLRPRGNFGEGLFLQQPIVRQSSEALGEDLRGYADDFRLERARPTRPVADGL